MMTVGSSGAVASNEGEGDYLRALFVDGEFIAARNAGMVAVIDPATGGVFRSMSYGGVEETQEALASAEHAFHGWSQTSARARADLLNRVAGLLRERQETIGRILCRETGKRLSEAIGEVRFSAEYFQWFAEEARRSYGTIIPGDSGARRQWEICAPVGVVGILTPWNFPVSIQARKLAAALAAGCTVVSRPSEKAPCAVVELFRCLCDAGIPRGVVNLVLGPASELTERIFAYPAVKVVSFTGSTAVGKRLMRMAASRVVRLSLELGGNAAFVVHDDADVESAVAGAMIAKFRNNGQSCIAANRFFIHERRYEEFVQRLSDAVGAMRVGNPMDTHSDLGPVIDVGSQQKLERAVCDALRSGAEVANREVSVPDTGTYVAPRIAVNVSADTFLGHEEVFGPVAAVFRYDDIDEVVAVANATDMGLAGYVYTRNLMVAGHLTEKLQAGIIGLNNPLPSAAFAPMGGVKESGFGREGGQHGLREFQDVRYVSMETAELA